MSHPPDCNCPECNQAFDPIKMKRFKTRIANFRNSLTEKELVLLRKRFSIPDPLPTDKSKTDE